VGCEPSCLFTLRDEHVSMLGGDPDVMAVAERVRQVEELLTEAIDDGRLVLAKDSPLAGRRILFHGHCHQKAEVGTAATVALLRRIPGAEVVELDAGCCGMAGSFGYEAEHYAISMKVGADRLFPAIDADADAVLAATGTSCRDQILHGTRRHARHPVELVEEALRPAGAGTGSLGTGGEADVSRGALGRVTRSVAGRAARLGTRGARAVRRRAS
jgi:Fe-S oxidoreductase